MMIDQPRLVTDAILDVVAAVRATTVHWLEAIYNRRRRHSAIDMLSPVDYDALLGSPRIGLTQVSTRAEQDQRYTKSKRVRRHHMWRRRGPDRAGAAGRSAPAVTSPSSDQRRWRGILRRAPVICPEDALVDVMAEDCSTGGGAATTGTSCESDTNRNATILALAPSLCCETSCPETRCPIETSGLSSMPQTICRSVITSVPAFDLVPSGQ
jgi:hypothetical protein